MNYENLFMRLWSIILELITKIEIAWDYINKPLQVELNLKIPYLLPDGINIVSKYAIIDYLGPAILVLIGLWIAQIVIGTFIMRVI